MRNWWTASVLVWGAVPTFAADVPLPERIEFNRDVRPILSDVCFRCHGPDKNTREADLRLDIASGYTGSGDKLGVVKPGKPAESELVRRVTSTDPDERMPPASIGKTLSPRDIAILTKWVEQGAAYQGHWAYIPPQRPDVPQPTAKSTIRNEIDRFILARLEAASLTPSAEADRVTLIRRLSFDLTGLPPSTADVDAFVQDTRPDAYERLVERLLESPQFGERMAVYWFDLVRFADTAGYHSDNPRDIAPYRDYVIRAFQENLPFDRFTIEQVAGDLLPNPTLQQKVASGYNRLLQTTEEGGAQPKEYIAKYAADRVRNVGAVWLGGTVMCAECHDHKFDPFTQRDFYSLAAFFGDVQEPVVGRREPGMFVPSEEQQRQWDELGAKVTAAQQALQQQAETLARGHTDWSPELSAAAWTVLTPSEAAVEGTSKLVREDDGSWRADGPVAAKETYVLTFPAETKSLTGLRLEGLVDDRFPNKGPGTATNGNFVMTEFKVAVLDAEGKSKDVKFAKAVADHTQNGHAIEQTFDGNPQTGWAVLPQTGKPHEAVFASAEPFVSEGAARFTVRLEFQSPHGQHNIGRFRLSATTASDPLRQALPPAVRTVLETAKAERTDAQVQMLIAYLRDQSPRVQTERAAVQTAQQQKTQFENGLPRSLISVAGSPRMLRVLPRGNWMDDSGEVREPAVPAFLGKVDVKDRRATRLDLAEWLVAADNPLPARVMMNRFWKLFFGTGLSKTVEDLGSQGEWPTHPELLDWLAVEFRERGWDMKHMIRLMVTSQAYRQSSVQSKAARAADPFNRLLSAQNRFRLDAEFIRDNALAISGTLSRRVGGESVFPYQPDGYWDYLNFPRRTWQSDSGEKQYRRGLYVWWQRSFLHPQMLIFDAPSREECTADRPRSNTPQQALALLNDPTFVEASRAFATRIVQHGGNDDAARLTWAFREAVSRAPKPEEAAVLMALLQKHRQQFTTDRPAADALLKAAGNAATPANVDPVELAAWTSVARALLNLHETVTRL